jgi:hypothetical protein
VGASHKRDTRPANIMRTGIIQRFDFNVMNAALWFGARGSTVG